MAKALKLILDLVGKLGELTPVVGDVIDNVKSKDGGLGRFFAPRFIKQIIRLIVAIAAVYLVLKGEISIEQLDELTK